MASWDKYPTLEKMPWGKPFMAVSVGAPEFAQTPCITATQPMTAEIAARVQMARCGVRFLVVQKPKVLRHFLIFAHRVGNARARIHAGKRRADDGQEHSERLDQHEGAAMPGPRSASPTTIIMSPIGAAEPGALALVIRYSGSSLRQKYSTNSRRHLGPAARR